MDAFRDGTGRVSTCRNVGAAAILASLLILSACVPLVHAKETKPSRTVLGVVTDENENPIQGAVVTLTDLQTGKKTAIYTGADGAYQYAGLEVTRDYDVQATFKGVASRLRKVSTVDPRSRITINLRIPPPKEEE